MTTLIVAEKPDAMEHIAKALAEKGLKKRKSSFGVDFFEFERGGEKFTAVCAVGHLFNLKQKGKGWDYPIFDVEWKPSFAIRKTSLFSEKYFHTIEDVIKNTKFDKYVSACDYDNEGAVIARNILFFICGVKDGMRMKFSTLTKQDLIKSFETASPHLDFPNIECGLARHYIDFFYGISASRALTLAIKKASLRFSLLTAGRVQGPVLSFLAEREKEIRAFIPVPFWEVQAMLDIEGDKIIAGHEKDKFWKKPEAEEVFNNSKSKEAVIESIEKKEYEQKVPVPFNITSLQTEAYRLFGYSPQQTMNIAQDLYTKAMTSYPRTSSEKMPPQIGYRDILQALAKIEKYKMLCEKLLKKSELKPNEGSKTDPAHECLHPTVEPPADIRQLKPTHQKIYDLICRRFFSVFGDPARRERVKLELKVGKEKYGTIGKKTLEKGWMEFYGPYAKFDEIIFPNFSKGDKIPVKNVEMLDKETQPPSRYSQASVIKEMETKGLGTRATRAAILQTLYSRNYIAEKSVRVTELGMKVAETLKKYVPDFVDEEMTKKMEEDMEKILEEKITKEELFEAAKKALIKISDEFRKNEAAIGKLLGEAVLSTQEDKATLGPCIKCGNKLKVLYSPFTKKRFCGCMSYFKCKDCGFTKKACKCKCPLCGGIKGKCECAWKEKKWNPSCQTGFPLPLTGDLTRLDKVCEECKTPIIRVQMRGRRPFNMCLDPNCPKKAEWKKKGQDKKDKLAKEAEAGKTEKGKIENKKTEAKGEKAEKTEAPAAESKRVGVYKTNRRKVIHLKRTAGKKV